MSSQEVVDFVKEKLKANPTKLSETCENVSGIGHNKSEVTLRSSCFCTFNNNIIFFNINRPILHFSLQLFDACIAPDTSGDGTGCDNMTCIIVKFNNAKLCGTRSIKRSSTELDQECSEPKKAKTEQGDLLVKKTTEEVERHSGGAAEKVTLEENPLKEEAVEAS